MGRPPKLRVTAMLSHPSPNHGPRRDALLPSLIVIHYTAMDTPEAALDRLCDPEAEVSAHYLIAADGTLCQLVEEHRRAWHAGAGRWGGIADVNSASIGIELDNDGTCPFPEAQIETLIELLAGIRSRWPIPAKGVIGHSDMAPGRKADPGPLFPWKALAETGHSIWPQPTASTPTETPFESDLARIGYTNNTDQTAVLDAFRLRFRPGHAGPPDATDHAIAADLAHRFPVDPPLREA